MFADVDDEGTQILSRSQLAYELRELPEPEPPARGIRAIMVYKFVRAGFALLLSATLAVTLATGHTEWLARFALHVRSHCSSAFSVALVEQLLQTVVPRRLWLVTFALLLDGIMTACEGWALRSGKRWGEWVVVIATGAFIPFELLAIWRSPHLGRVLLLLGNLLIAGYLVRRALREQSGTAA